MRCRSRLSTIFQDTHLSLATWFRARWHVTSGRTGVSALGLQRALGLGSCEAAWALSHKLHRARVRPGRDRLTGTVEVDETYWGGPDEGVIGRPTHNKALIIVAAEQDDQGVGRIRLRRIPDVTQATLPAFIAPAVEPGSTVRTDGLRAYLGLVSYTHDRRVQEPTPQGRRQAAAASPSGGGTAQTLAPGHASGRHPPLLPR